MNAGMLNKTRCQTPVTQPPPDALVRFQIKWLNATWRRYTDAHGHTHECDEDIRSRREHDVGWGHDCYRYVATDDNAFR